MTDISQIFPELRLPSRALIGVEEALEPAGESEFASTWNGRTVLLQPSYRTKYRVTLSADGDRVWTPSTDDLVPGSTVVVHSSVWWSATLAPGQTTKLLLRTPVPGSVAVRDTADDRIRVDRVVAGRTVTIAARATHTTILYRPVLTCIVGRMTLGGQATGRSQNWSLEMMEANAT